VVYGAKKHHKIKDNQGESRLIKVNQG